MRVPLFLTPRLQSYHEYSNFESATKSPQHNDIASVTSLILERRGSVKLNKFPNLITFKLVARGYAMLDILSKLATNALLCPNLTSMDWVSIAWWKDAEMKAGQHLDNRRRLVGKSIELACNHSDGDNQSGYAAVRIAFSTVSDAHDSQCYTVCNCDLPQNTNHLDYHNEERHIGDDSDEDIEDERYHNYYMDDYDEDDEDEDEDEM